MKIKIGDRNIELKYSMRLYVIYENITGESLDFKKFTFKTLITLFYANILSTLQQNHKNLDLTYDEYMNYLDSNPDILNEYAKWFLKCVGVNDEIIQEIPTDPKKMNSKKTQKKV